MSPSPSKTLSQLEQWRGDEVSQGPWFRTRLAACEKVFEYKQLNASATVLIPSKGNNAVFSVAHAKEHLAMSNLGTMLKPNMRGRESVTTSAPVTNPAVARSYLRPDPSTPTPPILPDTYANATTGARHISLMQSELGEHADGYKYAPEVIEMMDSQYLNEFLDEWF